MNAAALTLLLMQAAAADPVGQYLSDLEKSGVVKAEPAPSVEKIKQALIAAETDLVTGNPQVATTRLYRIIESPAWQSLSYSPEYQNAEFTLARALVKAGSYGSARGYLMRILRRGAKQPYFVPAYRAMLDVALESRDQSGVLAALDGVANGELPADSRYEHEYLRGKVRYEGGDLTAADGAFAAVDKQSRFAASALYFRGLIAARQGHYASARRNLCAIVEPVDNARFTFFIDGRYYAIKDLAYLALGRIAHEQQKYDDAYYFYFRVPEDSDRLPDALFEASWSMFQKGEYEAAGAFIDQFDRVFPQSPLAPDVLLLHAMIDLKSCAFDKVRGELDALVKTYVPIAAEVSAMIKDPSRRRAVYRRLLAKDRIGREGDRVVELLKIDNRFYRYYNQIVALDRDAGALPGQIAVWDELTAQRTGQARGSEATEAVQLAQQIAELAPMASGDPEMEAEVGSLLREAKRAARPVSTRGPYSAETETAQRLGGEIKELRARLVTAASTIAEAALVDLDARLRRMLRQARLTLIDAVIGKKKKLEIEIANLRDGRYPPDMFAKLQLEGLMGDDEEYWPFEGEYWSDEYSNYK